MTNTKTLAYQEIIQSGKAGSQRVEITKHLASTGPKSRREIANDMGYDLSAVCGRVNDLVAAGALQVDGTKICPYSKKLVEVIGVSSKPI